MRLLITGATGFVGGRIARCYVDRGDDVAVVVRTPSPDLAETGVTQISGGFAAIDPAMLEGVDVVVHAAAGSGPDLDTARAVNRDGTARIVDAATVAGVDRFVHISTTSVYVRSQAADGMLSEDSPLMADEDGSGTVGSPYAITKAEAEREVQRAVEAGLSAAILRPPAILGAAPTSTWGTRVPRLVIDGATLPMPSRTTFGWVHVDDLVDAAVAAGDTRDVFVANVVGGHVPFATYLDALVAMLPTPPSEPVFPDRDPWQGRYATGRATSILGIPIDRTFEDGMAEIADSWRAGDPGGEV